MINKEQYNIYKYVNKLSDLTPRDLTQLKSYFRVGKVMLVNMVDFRKSVHMYRYVETEEVDAFTFIDYTHLLENRPNHISHNMKEIDNHVKFNCAEHELEIHSRVNAYAGLGLGDSVEVIGSGNTAIFKRTSDRSYQIPCVSEIRDQSIPTNQGAFGTSSPKIRVYGNTLKTYEYLEQKGSTRVEYQTTQEAWGDVSRFGVSFILAEDLEEGDTLIWKCTTSGSGTYEQEFEVQDDVDHGTIHTLWFKAPVSHLAGMAYTEELYVGDELLHVYSCDEHLAKETTPWIKSMYRTYTDQEIGSGGSSKPSHVNMWIVDVKAVASGKNIHITNTTSHPSDHSISSFTSDTPNVIITVEWDRAGGYYTPPELLGGALLSEDDTESPILKATYSMDITDQLAVVFQKGDETLEVPCELLEIPVIEDVLLGTPPVGQIEIKSGDSVQVTVSSKTPIASVKGVANLTGISNAVCVFEDELYTTTVSLKWHNPKTTPTDLSASVVIYNRTNSESLPHTSSNTILSNNKYPSFTGVGIVYPVGQLAIKTDETANITVGIIDYSDTEYTFEYTTPTDQLTITDPQTYSKTKTVTYLNGAYNDANTNYVLGVIKRSNGAKKYSESVICIANTPPNLLSNDVFAIKSETGAQGVPISFDQKVRIHRAEVLPNTGVLPNTSTSVYTKTTKGIQINAVNGTVLSKAPKDLSLAVVGMAGLTNNVVRHYATYGFPQKTLTFTYPSFISNVGCAIIDTTNINISGTLNTTPPLEICKYYIANKVEMSLASQYSFNAGKTAVVLPEALKTVGYENGVTITIKIKEEI